jgi:hypothetical protein
VTRPQRSPIPAPRLALVKNLTPFVHFQCQKMAVGRRFHDTVVVKGTFVLAPDTLAIAGEQAPIVFADESWNAAGAARSSLKRAGEVVLAKPGTDVLVTGTARSPAGRALTEWDCAVVVRGPHGTLLSHTLQVTGPRSWVHRALRGWTLTDPEPAVSVPIRYELAYGGSHLDPKSAPADPRWIVHEPNPSGSGAFEDALDRGRAHAAPQWQLRSQPVSAMGREVPAAGFGPVARMWSSRRKYAGTYDQAWEERLHEDAANGLVADYPADFDNTFFQCAGPGLFTREPLRGDEHVGLAGLTGGANDLVLRLPGLKLGASLLAGTGQWQESQMALDTVHFDLDAARVHLCWRLSLDPERDVRAAVIVAEGESLHV